MHGFLIIEYVSTEGRLLHEAGALDAGAVLLRAPLDLCGAAREFAADARAPAERSPWRRPLRCVKNGYSITDKKDTQTTDHAPCAIAFSGHCAPWMAEIYLHFICAHETPK